MYKAWQFYRPEKRNTYTTSRVFSLKWCIELSLRFCFSAKLILSCISSIKSSRSRGSSLSSRFLLLNSLFFAVFAPDFLPEIRSDSS